MKESITAGNLDTRITGRHSQFTRYIVDQKVAFKVPLIRDVSEPPSLTITERKQARLELTTKQAEPPLTLPRF